MHPLQLSEISFDVSFKVLRHTSLASGTMIAIAKTTQKTRTSVSSEETTITLKGGLDAYLA